MTIERGHYDVAVVGGGPVGVLLACLLGQRGMRVALLEKRTLPTLHSQAIGITPPSLHLLEKLDLATTFIRHGVRVLDCVVHGQSGRLGCMTFRDIPDAYRFILSLPQSETVRLLTEKLRLLPSVVHWKGTELTDLKQTKSSCELGGRDTCSDHRVSLTASFVVACDGNRSLVRDLVGATSRGRSYGCHFAMGDFLDRSELGSEAHLYFTANGSVESFPLPCGLRRWIVQTPQRLDHVPEGLISELVKRRAGFDLKGTDQLNQNTFTPRRLNCDRYDYGRVLLAGDAAHVMSPIGGQGMNTGFADAEFLANAFEAILSRGEIALPLLSDYTRYRRHAAQTAISRAGRGMWLGTWRGKGASALRDCLLRNLFLNGPLASTMGPYFAMLTIPYNSLERVPSFSHSAPTT